MSLVLPVTPGTLPAGFCPADYQSMLNGFSGAQSVNFPSTFAGVTVSATKPTDTSKAWLQLDTLGRPVRLYYFSQGAWLSQHPMVPGSIIIWAGPQPTFTTFDGGDSNALSAISGPMWQAPVDAGGNPILVAQFPLGAGTLPSGKVIANGTVGGEENHQLIATEMPPHVHGMSLFSEATAYLNQDAAGGGLVSSGANFPLPVTVDNAGGDPNTTPRVAAGHNTLPPYYGVYFLQRSNRLFYAVN